MSMIDISNKSKAEVLAKLYNRSRPLGLGILLATDKPMSNEEAEVIVASSKRLYFDYLQGRVLKVDISGDELDPRLYDRDNGSGAALAALSQ